MIPGAAFSVHRLRARNLPVLHPVTRLGVLILGLATCLLAGPVLLGMMLVFLAFVMALSGLGPVAQLRSLRPWLPMGVIILLVHTFTTTAAAPLGTPTWAGVEAGLRSLLRVSCTVAWLAVYTRLSSLDDLVGGVRWWLRPAEKLGFPGESLGLSLAVALGTAPVVLGEGRRIEMVLRLRRSGLRGHTAGSPGSHPWRWLKAQVTRQLDRARVVVPLMEALGRRAEALSLSLRTRRPGSGGEALLRPSVFDLASLGVWLMVLTAAALWKRGPL